MAIEGIPESGRTRVYRKIVDQLKTDQTLEAAGVDWITWDGSVKVTRPMSFCRPTIVLFPTLEPMRVVAPDAQRGDLTIIVEMHVPGSFDACDCLDLWTAVEQALYPFNEREKQLAFQQALRGAGRDAETGEIEFKRPASVSPRFNEKSGGLVEFFCEGSMSIGVLRSINP